METILKPLIIYLTELIKIFLYIVTILMCILVIGKFLIAYKFIE
jgi:hypothetical protein